MNAEKLSKLTDQVRIGGKGTVRRKKKAVHRNTTDDKKLQNSLKKLGVNPIPGIEEVNMIKKDGSVIHFNNPKVQASLASNTFAIAGHAENKHLNDLMLPNFFNQLKPESLGQIKNLISSGAAGSAAAAAAAAVAASGSAGLTGDEEVPLVESFDDAEKTAA